MNNKYSVFTQEQIITPNYMSVCDQLLGIVKDEEIKERCRQILYEGGYGAFSADSRMTKNTPSIERKKRLQFAYLLATNPETFEVISKSNVNLFHGTNINALPGILQYGMMSGQKMTEKRLTISTGEEWSRRTGQRNWISFTDYLATAIDYASIQPSNNSSHESTFGVLIGISSNDAKHKETCYLTSPAFPEAAIADDILPQEIKVILAPEDKVEFIRKLVGAKGISVNSMDLNIQVYIDLMNLSEHYNAQKASELFNTSKQSKIKTTFSIEHIKKLAESRILSKIRIIYVKIKEIFNSRGRINGEDARNK